MDDLDDGACWQEKWEQHQLVVVAAAQSSNRAFY